MKLFYVCLAWMAGIALGAACRIPVAAGLLAGGFCFLGALTFGERVRLAGFCLAALLLGLSRAYAAAPTADESFIGSHIGAAARIQIIVQEDAFDGGGRIAVPAVVEELDTGERSLSGMRGMVLVQFREPPAGWMPVYGDRVFLEGRLLAPPGVDGFDYPAYLARQEIYAVLEDPRIVQVAPGNGNPILGGLHAVRRASLRVLRDLYPEPEASLLSGILLGVDDGIPPGIKQAFSRTGTSHIVAISGFNISIVASLILALTRRLPGRFPAWIIALGGIALYTILVGASASVVRAALMGGLAVVARTLGRRSHGLTSLAFGAALMCGVHPPILADIGFQLSAAATLGLILYADPLQALCESALAARVPAPRARQAAELASELLLMTLAAQITTLPIILYHFQSYSLSALIVNPLALPVQPMVMIAGGAVLLLGLAWLPLARLAAWIAWAPAAYTIRVVEWGASFTAGWQPVGDVSIGWVILFYALLFAVTALAAAGKLPRPAWPAGLGPLTGTAAIPLLAAAVFVVWSVAFSRPDGRLHVTLLPLDKGESILIQTPGGRRILIDAGGDDTSTVAALGRTMGFAQRRLDWVIVAGTADSATAGWEEVGNRFEVGGVLLAPGADTQARSLASLLAGCRRNGVPVVEAESGRTLDLGDGSRLVVLAADEAGLALVVEMGDARLLLPAGLSSDVMERLLAGGRVPPSQVLLLADGGSPSVNSREWLEAVRMQVGVSFAGGDAEFYWPRDLPLLRADLRGWVEVITDGSRLWVRTQR